TASSPSCRRTITAKCSRPCCGNGCGTATPRRRTRGAIPRSDALPDAMVGGARRGGRWRGRRSGCTVPPAAGGSRRAPVEAIGVDPLAGRSEGSGPIVGWGRFGSARVVESAKGKMITIQHEGSLTVVGVFAKFELADYKRFEEEVLRQLGKLGKVNLLVDLRDMLGYTL